ncbi:TPA: hypothetical protein QDB01_000359 [Burkholderia vietnamiensis]|nr:hypothetical protein [Burkholderia vietnamiensis]
MQDYTSLDPSRNAPRVTPLSVLRHVAGRVQRFYLSPGLSRRTRVLRFGWTAAAAVAVVVLVQQMLPSRPAVVVAPPPMVAPPMVAPVEPLQKPLPPDVAKMFTQQQLDQKRDQWVDQTQAMAAETEKRAPGSIQAYQARSFADFLAAHCGKPGGCLKKP